MHQYEYRFVSTPAGNGSELESFLNKWGNDGWVVCNLTFEPKCVYVLFMKEKPQTAATSFPGSMIK